MAKLTGLRSMLEVFDMDETIAFYERLGFTLVGSMGEPKPFWAQVRRDDVALMFSWEDAHTHDDGSVHEPNPTMSGALYISVDDVDALFAEVRDRVKEFDAEPTTQPHGMREFAVTDPNGYHVIFGSPVG